MRVPAATGRLAAGLLAATALALVLAPAAPAKRATVTVRTVDVGARDNPAVAVVPFSDAIYQSCDEAPQTSAGCQVVGGVDYRFGIGRLEVTVEQWVDFLNTVDPTGADRHGLHDPSESGKAWPKYGQVNRSRRAPDGSHYTVARPEWADKPYGFANFLRAARFANSLFNGRLLAKTTATESGFEVTAYRVRLSPRSERGMYDLRHSRRDGATRAHRKGFVIPSQDEWIKAAYYDPAGGGTYSYWKYPTNAGVFGDDVATAPAQSTLDPTTGEVANTATQPLATYHDPDLAAPSWCPAEIDPSRCSSVNPFGIDPTTYAEIYQGSLGTVGQAATASPWGTLDQGGNAVEWTDTITPPPAGDGGGRVWRRLHGGVPNAPAYQLWLSAVGLQPENNRFYKTTYPWLGFRVGAIGKLEPESG